ncbi:unnamed protein product, partial [Nesidiocoris tenuis]
MRRKTCMSTIFGGGGTLKMVLMKPPFMKFEFGKKLWNSGMEEDYLLQVKKSLFRESSSLNIFQKAAILFKFFWPCVFEGISIVIRPTSLSEGVAHFLGFDTYTGGQCVVLCSSSASFAVGIPVIIVHYYYCSSSRLDTFPPLRQL